MSLLVHVPLQPLTSHHSQDACKESTIQGTPKLSGMLVHYMYCVPSCVSIACKNPLILHIPFPPVLCLGLFIYLGKFLSLAFNWGYWDLWHILFVSCNIKNEIGLYVDTIHQRKGGIWLLAWCICFGVPAHALYYAGYTCIIDVLFYCRECGYRQALSPGQFQWTP